MGLVIIAHWFDFNLSRVFMFLTFKIIKKSAELAFKSAWRNLESFGSGGALQRVVVARGGDVVALGDDVVALSGAAVALSGAAFALSGAAVALSGAAIALSGAAIALSGCVAVVRRAYIDLEMESLS